MWSQDGFPSDHPTWAYEGAKYGWNKFLGQQLPHFLQDMK